MKFESIELFDFRCHKHLYVSFSPNVTTLIGKSYAGKSTVIRALLWVCLNKPAGRGMIRWGAKRAKVVLRVDGHVIIRIRGRVKNIYKMDGHTYAAFGNSVPKPIAQVLNISESNFQGQHELPFWFGQSAGAVSRELNKIVNLEIIDRTLGNLATAVSHASTKVAVTKERLLAARQQRQRLAYVNRMGKDWQAVQKAIADYKAAEDAYQQIYLLFLTCKEAKAARDKQQPPPLTDVRQAVEAYIKAEDKLRLLSTAIDAIKQQKTTAIASRHKADKLQKRLAGITKGRCPLCGRV